MAPVFDNISPKCYNIANKQWKSFPSENVTALELEILSDSKIPF